MSLNDSVRAGSNQPEIAKLLEGHPRIEWDASLASSGIAFQTNRVRQVLRPADNAELSGLVELMDNNPLVCADAAGVPSPAGTLALIGLGPLCEAGLIVEPPAVLLSFEDEEEGVTKALESVNWFDGITFQCENHDLGTVQGAYILAKISNPENFDEIDAIFDERYGRSFLVRREEVAPWDAELVRGKPWACYRLELSEGEKESILSIHVMADINGKLGAGQYVHMMNVMCGFEESLGLI